MHSGLWNYFSISQYIQDFQFKTRAASDHSNLCTVPKKFSQKWSLCLPASNVHLLPCWGVGQRGGGEEKNHYLTAVANV